MEIKAGEIMTQPVLRLKVSLLPWVKDVNYNTLEDNVIYEVSI